MFFLNELQLQSKDATFIKSLQFKKMYVIEETFLNGTLIEHICVDMICLKKYVN